MAAILGLLSAICGLYLPLLMFLTSTFMSSSCYIHGTVWVPQWSVLTFCIELKTNKNGWNYQGLPSSYSNLHITYSYLDGWDLIFLSWYSARTEENRLKHCTHYKWLCLAYACEASTDPSSHCGGFVKPDSPIAIMIPWKGILLIVWQTDGKSSH